MLNSYKMIILYLFFLLNQNKSGIKSKKTFSTLNIFYFKIEIIEKRQKKTSLILSSDNLIISNRKKLMQKNLNKKNDNDFFSHSVMITVFFLSFSLSLFHQSVKCIIIKKNVENIASSSN